MRAYLKVIVFFLPACSYLFANQVTLNMSARHLAYNINNSPASTGDNYGRIGRYARFDNVQYSDELMCKADLSGLSGATITIHSDILNCA